MLRQHRCLFVRHRGFITSPLHLVLPNWSGGLQHATGRMRLFVLRRVSDRLTVSMPLKGFVAGGAMRDPARSAHSLQKQLSDLQTKGLRLICGYIKQLRTESIMTRQHGCWHAKSGETGPECGRFRTVGRGMTGRCRHSCLQSATYKVRNTRRTSRTKCELK